VHSAVAPGRTTGDSRCSSSWEIPARGAGGSLPPSDERGHAPARDDRDGARVHQAAHCRRAHHGPRRDDPARSSSCSTGCRPSLAWRSCSSRTTRGRGGQRRPRRGDVTRVKVVEQAPTAALFAGPLTRTRRGCLLGAAARRPPAGARPAARLPARCPLRPRAGWLPVPSLRTLDRCRAEAPPLLDAERGEPGTTPCAAGSSPTAASHATP